MKDLRSLKQPAETVLRIADKADPFQKKKVDAGLFLFYSFESEMIEPGKDPDQDQDDQKENHLNREAVVPVEKIE